MLIGDHLKNQFGWVGFFGYTKITFSCLTRRFYTNTYAHPSSKEINKTFKMLPRHKALIPIHIIVTKAQ